MSIKTVGYFFLLGLLTGSGLLAQDKPTAPLFEVTATKYLLGTQVDIIAVGESVQSAKQACYFAFREMERIERILSSHREDSEIGRINKQAGLQPVPVSPETFAILQRALNYSRRFQGLFDISIGTVLHLWGFNEDRDIRLPPPDSLRQRLALVNYRYIRLNPQDTTVALLKPGMRIDLGGIAKGYAIDRAAATMRRHGIRRFLINAGGDIYAAGRKANGQPWRIGIKHPRELNSLLATFELSDYAVATSGDYERYAILNGRRYHHILDPRTGYPASGYRSVTVLARTAEAADVWATYLFILGRAGYKKAHPLPVTALFVDQRGRVEYDPVWREKYRLQLVQ